MRNYDQKKILFFTNSLKSGGKERRLLELIKFLEAKGGYKILLVLTSGEIHYESFHRLKTDHIVLDKKLNDKDITIFWKFFEIVKKFQPDIIHTWGDIHSFYALPSSILLGKPLINSQIASAPPSVPGLFSFKGFINRVNFLFSSIVLSNSYAGLDAYGLSGEKYKVIHNGVDLNRFNYEFNEESIRKKFQLSNNFLVVMIGNITDRKNHKLFVKAANLVLKKRKDIFFLIAGRKVDRRIVLKLKELIGDNVNHIRLLGRINNVEELVFISDLGVLFSNKENHGEGIPNSVIEYMGLGKPVIVNDAGGTCELVKDKKNGFVIDEDNPEKVAGLILDIIENRDLQKEYGEYGKWIVKEHFSIEKMGDSFEDLYKSLF